MKPTWMLLLAAASYAYAPEIYAQETKDVIYQTAGPVTSVAAGAVIKGSMTLVKGAPYFATITNESVQTLADGNRIVQTNSGSIARDSQGRTRQETALPSIGNLSAAEAPRLVFIQDPIAQVSYTLNLTEKTAQKIPMPPAPPAPAGGSAGGSTEGGSAAVLMPMATAGPLSIAAPTGPGPDMAMQKFVSSEVLAHVSSEDLGSQSMEGVVVNGTRTTRTIPAGQIGNDKPITIVTEVWTSPDLKTIVSSKRSDPRMGDMTFQLSNLVRAEPDPSLFVVPPDFKIVDGPQSQHVIYRSNR
jgi:hypothetical protein